MRRREDPDKRRQRRIRIVSGLAVLASLAAAVRSADIAAELARRSPDPFRIGAAVLGFSPLASRLPAGEVVGYLTDLPPGDRAIVAFVQAQYALAPRLLRRLPVEPSPRWAVGRFSRPLDAAAWGAPHGYVVEQDFGGGIVLFRRASR